MKKRFCPLFVLPVALLALAATSVQSARAATACYPLPDGITAQWPGDGHAAGFAGDLAAVLHGDATTGPGLVGRAFVLDGDGDYVEVPHSQALNVGGDDFTVALWVNFSSTANEQVLVEKYIEDLSSQPPGWTFTKLEDNSLRFGTGPGPTVVDSPPLDLPINTWIHLAVRRSSGLGTIYVNGAPVAVGFLDYDADSTASLKLGHRGNPADTPGSQDERGFFLNGRLDEVQLYVGRALPASAIRAIYDAGGLGSCPAAASPSLTPQGPTVERLYPQLAGAFIELRAEPLRAGLWTCIQWQDAHGGWQDMEGWQGSFDADRRVFWYVGEEHLGEGPFRWLVYETQGGRLLATSQPFDLPSSAGEVLHVQMAVPEASSSAAATPVTPAMVVYSATFDTLALGPTEPSPGAAGQDGWYQQLARAPAYGEIQERIAVSGRALHESTTSGVSGLYQTIDARPVTPPDLSQYPLITLQVDFYAHTSDLQARNVFDAFIRVNGGPHPGYEIAAIGLISGNGVPRGEAGVNIVLNSYNGRDNNIPVFPGVGQVLAWDSWHRVTLVADQAVDRYVSITVDGRTEDLSAYTLPRSGLNQVWRRGQLMEAIMANIAPHADFGDSSEDDVYWDNLTVTVGPAQR